MGKFAEEEKWEALSDIKKLEVFQKLASLITCYNIQSERVSSIYMFSGVA